MPTIVGKTSAFSGSQCAVFPLGAGLPTNRPQQAATGCHRLRQAGTGCQVLAMDKTGLACQLGSQDSLANHSSKVYATSSKMAKQKTQPRPGRIGEIF